MVNKVLGKNKYFILMFLCLVSTGLFGFDKVAAINKRTNCQKMMDGITKNNLKIAQTYQTHSAYYTRLGLTLESLIVDLQKKGYDTTKLNSYYDELKVKVKTFEGESKQYSTSVTEARRIGCFKENSDISKQIKNMQKTLRESAKTSGEIRNLYNQKIRKNILELVKPK